MLPTENRLAKVRDFTLVMTHGIWINGQNITIKVLDLVKNKSYFPKKENTEIFAKQLKIAFTVGLKVSKSAVVRNRIKRQMREVIRLLLKDKRIPSGYFILFVARPSVVGADYAAIQHEVENLLKRAKLLS